MLQHYALLSESGVVIAIVHSQTAPEHTPAVIFHGEAPLMGEVYKPQGAINEKPPEAVTEEPVEIIIGGSPVTEQIKPKKSLFSWVRR